MGPRPSLADLEPPPPPPGDVLAASIRSFARSRALRHAASSPRNHPVTSECGEGRHSVCATSSRADLAEEPVPFDLQRAHLAERRETRDETRRDEPSRDETRRDETRRDETRRDEARWEVRDATRRRDEKETRRDETRRDPTRRDPTRRAATRRDETRRDERRTAPRRSPRRTVRLRRRPAQRAGE